MKRSPMPRATIWLALPRSRPADRPGRRASDSAIVVSGSLPMSSDATTSTILFEFSFTDSALRSDARTPETTTCCTAVSPPAAGSAGAGAGACWAKATVPAGRTNRGNSERTSTLMVFGFIGGISLLFRFDL